MKNVRNATLALCIVALGVLAPAARPAHAAAADAVAVVERFHDSLLAVMKDAKALGVRGRYDRLAGPVRDAFHLPLMIRIAAGSFWRDANDGQKAELVRAFTRMSVSTYAARFDGYSGEAFHTLEATPGPQDTLIVQTQIVRPAAVPVGISYVMRESGQRWRIVDVLLDDSVSELAVRRSEYRHILDEGGIDGLIHTLDSKADQLTRG